MSLRKEIAMAAPSANPLSIRALRTRTFQVQESLLDFAVDHVPESLISESMILAVTTKIVSLAEGRVVSKSSIGKAALIDREADQNLGPIGYGSILTIKEGLLIASAGIDESNSEHDDYIIYPEDPSASARSLYEALRRRWKLESLGIIFTDSRTSPLRLGVTGVCVAHWGFHALQSKVGHDDLFGRPLQMTKVNIADALAGAATLMMGEADESCPLAVIHGANTEFSPTTDASELKVPLEQDLYAPLFTSFLKSER